MKALVLAVIVVLALECCLAYPTTKENLKGIAERAKTWKAGYNMNFLGWHKHDVQKLLGWKRELERKDLDKNPVIAIPDSAIPVNFTASQNWPNCKTIGTIYNQARCGSCWAFGGVESASDRFCIATKGKINQPFSFAEITECSTEADGCDGGSASAVWDFIQSPGIVTDTCYPYYIPTCAPDQQPCLNFVETPQCLSSCNATGQQWVPSILSNYYDVAANATAIQSEIYANGPVEACFTVYSDFLQYKSGVYQYQNGTALGGHCIKIIGWGVEDGLPYWLINNSWTTSWGDNGQFKILRGQDECGIEDSVVAGMP